MSARVDEIAEGVYRFSVPVAEIGPPEGFTFNSFLIDGDDRLGLCEQQLGSGPGIVEPDQPGPLSPDPGFERAGRAAERAAAAGDFGQEVDHARAHRLS